MAITTAMCNSFKQELLGGVHDLDTDTIKIALIKNSQSGTYNASTANYSTVTGNSDEATGTNYTTGGNTLTGQQLTNINNVATVDFAQTVWGTPTAATFTAAFGAIYNSTQSDKLVVVLDFGGDKSCSNGTFTITFPDATTGSPAGTDAILSITS